MIIKDARIVMRDRIFEGDLQYERGRVKRIGKDISGDEKVNANGHYVLPGAVDAHVHFRDPEAPNKENFTTGSVAALAGGVTTVIDMPSYRGPSTTTLKALKAKFMLVSGKSVCDFALHFGATMKNFAEAKKAAKLCAGLKMFLCGSGSEMALMKSEVIERHFRNFDKKKPVVIHCEDQEAIPKNAEELGPEGRAKARGPNAALTGLSKACILAKGRKIHIAHATTVEEVELAKAFPNVTCEVTPHHLFLSIKDLDLLGEYGKTNPPLRREEQRLALWNRLDKIDVIASDHAPHTRAEKESGNAPPGVPGVETMLPLMLTAVNEGNISLVRLCQMISTRPAEIFGLKRKGGIEVGKDADFLIVDMKEEWRLHEDDLHSKCGWSPFTNYGMKGKIRSVILRGTEVFYDGKLLVKPGFGRHAR